MVTDPSFGAAGRPACSDGAARRGVFVSRGAVWREPTTTGGTGGHRAALGARHSPPVRSFDRLEETLSSPQPLWQFWDFIHDPSNSARTMEFIALANHRKAIQAEIADYSRRFRKRELELLTGVLEGHGLDPVRWPPASIVLSLSGISRFLLIEQAFGVDVGHADTIAVIEREIRALEGERGT